MKRMKLFKISVGFVLLIVIIWAISCAVNPVTKKREFMLLTESDEIMLGKQTDGEVLQIYGKYEDATLDAYVNTLGQKMAKLSHRPTLNFSFKVLDSPVINAFAVPGGFVYFTRGILGYLNNEAELAGVMGHEIGHITARHSAQQYSKSMVAQLGLGIGSAVSETFRKYAGLANFGVSMLFLRFSRDNERQADQLGVEYSTRTGFDANHMANFFVTLERLNPGEDMSGLPGWFSTHPNPPDRIAAIKKDAVKWQAKFTGTSFSTNRDDYLKKIDGIIYGEDPRQGYIEGNMFYHPMLKFQFPVPGQWQLNNTPAQVQVVSQAQDAIIIFSMARETDPTSAATAFINNSQAVVIRSDNLSVNGMPARAVESKITSEGTVLHVISYFIQMDQTVYLFHSYTTDDKFSAYLSQFRPTMEQFKRLTDAGKMNVKPARLRIKKTTSAGTLREAFNKLGVPANRHDELAITNGLNLTDTVPANALLKIVEK